MNRPTRRVVASVALLAIAVMAVVVIVVTVVNGMNARSNRLAATVDGVDPYHPDHRVDVQHYTFRLEVNDDNDSLRGEASITILVREAGVESVKLNLVQPGASSPGMTVSGVGLAEPHAALPLRFEHQGDVVEIELGEVAKAGEHVIIDVAYAGIPADGLIISSNKHGARTFFGDNWPNRARYWLPTVDHVSDKATVEFLVVAPRHYDVIASGLQIEQRDVNGDLRLTHYKSDIPMATKVMVVGIARFAIDQVGTIADVPLSSWVYPEDRDAGFSDYRRAIQVVEYFVDRIGPFPYAKLANVQSTTRYGGMENAGNIFYAENSVTGTGRNESVIAHEIAHQWFGDSVTEADWYHIWLSEGFATYFTQLYMEETYGRDRMNEGLVAQRGAVVEYAKGNPESPVIDTTIVDLNDLLSTNSYQKGGWVLHMLRRQIGAEDFWKGIRSYYATNRDHNAWTSDLQDSMEEASGQKLGWFFDQWLRRPGQPTIDAVWSAGDDGVVSVTVEQTQSGPGFRFPLDIGFLSAAGARLDTATLEVFEKRQTFQLELPVVPASAVLDPDVWLLTEGAIRRR